MSKIISVLALIAFMFAPMKQGELKHDHRAEKVRLINSILPRLAWVESSSNRHAYNARTQAVGLFQIVTNETVALAHYNAYNKRKRKYTTLDMYNPRKARVVAFWALWHCMKAHPDSLERAITAYNAGASRASNVIYTNYCNNILNNL